MSNEQPHSGSRWEPTASTGEAVDGVDDATERVVPPAGPARDENHEAAADERPGAAMSPDGETATDRIATPAAHAAPGLGVFPAVPVGASPKPLATGDGRASWRRSPRGCSRWAVSAGTRSAARPTARPPGSPGPRASTGTTADRRMPTAASGAIGTATVRWATARRRRLGRNCSRRHRFVGYGYRRVPAPRHDHRARDAFRPAGAVDRQPRRAGRRRGARRRRRRGRRRAAAGDVLVDRRRRAHRPDELGERADVARPAGPAWSRRTCCWCRCC